MEIDEEIQTVELKRIIVDILQSGSNRERPLMSVIDKYAERVKTLFNRGEVKNGNA